MFVFTEIVSKRMMDKIARQVASFIAENPYLLSDDFVSISLGDDAIPTTELDLLGGYVEDGMWYAPEGGTLVDLGYEDIPCCDDNFYYIFKTKEGAEHILRLDDKYLSLMKYEDIPVEVREQIEQSFTDFLWDVTMDDIEEARKKEGTVEFWKV